MRFLLALGFVALAAGQLPVPPVPDIRTCLNSVRQTISEWEGMGNNWIQAKMTCKERCRSGVPPSIQACLPQGPEEERKMQMMQEMHRSMKEGIQRGIEALEADLAAGTAQCNNPPEPALRITGGDVSKIQKLNKHIVTGPFCFMAMMTRFFPQPSRRCMCDCIRSQLPPQMVPTIPEIMQKINWFRGGAQGFPPEPIARHSPKHAALCIFRACDKATLMRAVEASGLRQIKGRMICNMIKGLQGFPEKCSCLARAAVTAGVPQAPTEDDCRCLVPPPPQPFLDFVNNMDCNNVDAILDRLTGPGGLGGRVGSRLLSRIGDGPKGQVKDMIEKIFKGEMRDMCPDKDRRCQGWMIQLLEEMRDNIQSGGIPGPGVPFPSPRAKREVEEEIDEFFELADMVL